MERETGIGPATNSLEGCDSTTELLPHYETQRTKQKLMELAERIELSTSPLPRECSATELRQHAAEKPTLQSYRERSLPSITRKAKNPKRIHVNDRYLPGSIVCQASTAKTPSPASAITILPLPAGLRSTTLTSTTKTYGAQGRIRTFVAHNAADLQSAAINHSATCALCCLRILNCSLRPNLSSPRLDPSCESSGRLP
jgi:hypothetical protein